MKQDDGTWTTGTIISDGSVAVLSFAEDMDVRYRLREQYVEHLCSAQDFLPDKFLRRKLFFTVVSSPSPTHHAP